MQDGMAVCESCGMKFSKDEVKKMVVELSGPIQIDGEVKVAGGDDADSFYKRAKDAERIGDLDHARKTYNDATKKYPGDARLWLGWANLNVTLMPGKMEKGFREWDDDEHGIFWTSLPYELRQLEEFHTQTDTMYERAKLCAEGSIADEVIQSQERFHQLLEEYRLKVRQEQNKRKAACYWAKANAEFLNSFPGSSVKGETLAFLLKQDVNEFRKECRRQVGSNFDWIKSFEGVQGSKIRFNYRFSGKGYSGSHHGSIDLPEGMTIEGDIRPMMDGFTYKEKGLFGGKKTYSYANDPDKDKGPTFDE